MGYWHDGKRHAIYDRDPERLYERIQDKDAQELLGHSSIAVTRDVYTHIRKSRKGVTAKRLNRYVMHTLATKTGT